MNELKLVCIFCGGHAQIVGRCATARVVCRDCHMETRPEAYRDQIENWKETVCKKEESEGG